jgi:NAD(P)-dependent dehydrogenase (short-subunit alcohol dehydrogenase family)
VFITGRRKDVLDKAVAEIGRNVTGVQGDVANLAELDGLYEAVRRKSRKIDVIFANAGIAQLAPFGSVDEKFYDLHFNANAKGLFFTGLFGGWQQDETLDKLKEDLAKNVPLGRMGDPDEIAKTVSFLASDEASYNSGIELYVDGGVDQI